MWKRLSATFGMLLLTGCPYNEGCEAPQEAPANPQATEETAPAPGETPEDGSKPGEGGGSTRQKSAPIDFGTEPTGGARLSTLTCPALAMPLPGGSAIVYVDAKATGAENGSKTAPFRTIGRAMENAPQAAAIWVAAGTYKENLSPLDKDLVVFGGFASGFGSRTDACATVIEPATPTVAVITVGREVLSFGMEGVTVQKSVRGLSVTGDETVEGNITVARCVFRENGTKTTTGGGVELGNVNARVFMSVFKDNIASKGAALVYDAQKSITIDQNLFDHNLGYSDHGGGIYLTPKMAKVSRNTFRGNATGIGINDGAGGGWGGAAIIDNDELDKPTHADFSYNIFTENTAGIGGGIFVDQGASLTMSHDVLYRNRSYLEGTDTPDTFAALRGSAIYVDGTGLGPEGASTFTGEYLTVVDNAYDSEGRRRTNGTFGGNIYVEGFSKATVKSSIFWNNGTDGFYVESNSTLTVSNSIGATSCTSSNPQGLIPASATICRMGADVFLPPSLAFADANNDDYRQQGWPGLGAFANIPGGSTP